MDATTYTGNGTTQTITNAGGFQPDFVWVKNRTSALNHILANTVAGITNFLSSNTTAAESSTAGVINAVNSNGFSVGSISNVNQNTDALVGWQWKAGGTAVSNTAGTITSSVSANTTSGFSVATYTSQASGTATVGHGLGVAPKMIIIKPRTGTLNWYIYHASLGAGNYILFTTAGTVASSTLWNNTAPTSSVFSLGTDWNGSISSVAYCWSEVAGYSKFGSYTGNGSADGPFVYTGFRPRFIMWKNTSTGSQWRMHDTSRSPYNASVNSLRANGANAEDTSGAGDTIDFLSNGYKVRAAGTDINDSGNVYIYATFAENPFKYALAR
jgi:hypothetical protein